MDSFFKTQNYLGSKSVMNNGSKHVPQISDERKLNNLINKDGGTLINDPEITSGNYSKENDHETGFDTIVSDNKLSGTESNIDDSKRVCLQSTDYENTESNDEQTNAEKHPLIKKKSGEVVKPSLKEISTMDRHMQKQRSKSLPSTPTYKQVHFGNDNGVRYFKKKDKPTTISASGSPTNEDPEYFFNISDSDTEDQSNGQEEDHEPSDENIKAPPFELSFSPKYLRSNKLLFDWKLDFLNIPEVALEDKVGVSSPVFLEKLFLSLDKSDLIGIIAVKNLAYEKLVHVRYTIDNWLTFIEIPASYSPDTTTYLKNNNYDRFDFRIRLDTLFNGFGMQSTQYQDKPYSISKVYQFCVRYKVNNEEFWGNNNRENYTIRLTKSSRNYINPKIQAHDRKPKYSSSFRRRRSVDTESETDSDALQLHDKSSSEADEPVSQKTKKEQSSAGEETKPKYSAPRISILNDLPASFNLPQNRKKNPSEEEDSRFSKSYQELLDKCCFSSSMPPNDYKDDLALL